MTVINSWLCCIYRRLAFLPFFSWWDPVCRRSHLNNIPALFFISQVYSWWMSVLVIAGDGRADVTHADRCLYDEHEGSRASFISQSLNIQLMIRARTCCVLMCLEGFLLIRVNDVWCYCWMWDSCFHSMSFWWDRVCGSFLSLCFKTWFLAMKVILLLSIINIISCNNIDFSGRHIFASKYV